MNPAKANETYKPKSLNVIKLLLAGFLKCSNANSESRKRANKRKKERTAISSETLVLILNFRTFIFKNQFFP